MRFTTFVLLSSVVAAARSSKRQSPIQDLTISEHCQDRCATFVEMRQLCFSGLPSGHSCMAYCVRGSELFDCLSCQNVASDVLRGVSWCGDLLEFPPSSSIDPSSTSAGPSSVSSATPSDTSSSPPTETSSSPPTESSSAAPSDSESSAAPSETSSDEVRMSSAPPSISTSTAEPTSSSGLIIVTQNRPSSSGNIQLLPTGGSKSSASVPAPTVPPSRPVSSRVSTSSVAGPATTSAKSGAISVASLALGAVVAAVFGLTLV